MDLSEARLALWVKAGADPAEALCTLAPSIDVLTLAFSALAQECAATAAAFAELKVAYDALAERERREHRPVSGRITFGRPVKGVVSFPVPRNP